MNETERSVEGQSVPVHFAVEKSMFWSGENDRNGYRSLRNKPVAEDESDHLDCSFQNIPVKTTVFTTLSVQISLFIGE